MSDTAVTTTQALAVENLHLAYKVRGVPREVLRGVTFHVRPGEAYGLVGESGCGKSTTGRAIMQLPRPTSGEVVFDGTELTALSGEALRAVRPKLQMIFQDPISSLNPRRRIEDIIAEGLDIWGLAKGKERDDKVDEMLDAVGMDPALARGRRPHQFSGGQCQRISIARAVITSPKVIICDEPVSALDVSVQAQILNLLQDMKARYGLTLVFIAHDLAVVKNVSDRVAVMYLGKLCEIAPPDELYRQPLHPYTSALLASIPIPDPQVRPEDRELLAGEIPSPIAPPSGCRFRTRCPRAQEKCAQEEPVMVERSPGHFMACHFPLDEPVSGMPAGSAPAEAPRVEPVEPVDPVDAPVDPVDAPVTAAEE
jgi:peptide/nickel transport system ATP-binding protein